MNQPAELRPAVQCLRLVTGHPVDHAAEGPPAPPPRNKAREKLELEIDALLAEIVLSYGQRRTKDLSNRVEVARVWTKNVLEDGWNGAVLWLGWKKHRQDIERAVYVPGYMDLVQAAHPPLEDARALCDRFVRIKSAGGNLAQLTPQEYHVYKQCSGRLRGASDGLCQQMRKWMLEAWMYGDERLESAPEPVPEDRQLPARVKVPDDVINAQMAQVRQEPGAFLQWCPNDIYRKAARRVLDAPGERPSPLAQHIVAQYLHETGQISEAWEAPRPQD